MAAILNPPIMIDFEEQEHDEVWRETLFYSFVTRSLFSHPETDSSHQLLAGDAEEYDDLFDLF